MHSTPLPIRQALYDLIGTECGLHLRIYNLELQLDAMLEHHTKVTKGGDYTDLKVGNKEITLKLCLFTIGKIC